MMPRRAVTKLQAAALLAIVVIVALVGVYYATLPPAKAPPREILVGSPNPLTGSASKHGVEMKNAISLAVEQWNAKGGVYVKEFDRKLPIRVIFKDTESSRDTAVKVMTELVTVDKVDVVIGNFGSAIVFADQVIAMEHKVPYITSGASSVTLTRRTDIDVSYYFNTATHTELYPFYTMPFLDGAFRPALNKKFGFPDSRNLRLAILYQDSPYGKGVLEGCKLYISKFQPKIEIVESIPFKLGETDFRPHLLKIKESKPDFVYMAAFIPEQTAALTQARRDVGLNTLFQSVICNDDEDFYRGVGQWGDFQFQETTGTTSVPVLKGPTKENGDRFVGAYRAKYSRLPAQMATHIYQTFNVVMRAIERAGTLDKKAIRDALERIELKGDDYASALVCPYEGDVFRFTKDHLTSMKIAVVQMRWNEAKGENELGIVWPEEYRTAELEIPPWYAPGS
jgi:branched-chain amino acid transport system substrate-binding protein